MSLKSDYYDRSTGFLYRLTPNQTKLSKLPIEFLDQVEPHQTPSRLKPIFIDKFLKMVASVLSLRPTWKVTRMGFDSMGIFRWELANEELAKNTEIDTAWCAARYHEVLNDASMHAAILKYIDGD